MAAAAARHLTPVTLELGGKSPCIVDASCADLAGAALKIAHGKLLNGGQTCIAPDYLLLPRGREAAFADAARRAVARLFPHLAGTPDSAAIVNARQHERLRVLVAEAAARHLTPTTLELGGKSPCIVDTSCADLGSAALKIAHGKLLNGGQTCIAPDYLLLPRGREAAFADAYRRAVARLFPHLAGNPDYAAIIDARQHERLRTLVDEARALGARVEDASPSDWVAPAAGPAARQMAPLLVWGAPPAARLMQEEIFGPVLPVLAYDRLEDAIAHINARPRPLALYWFGDDADAQRRVLEGTVSGGVTVNDTLMHIAHDGLPFGGVGDSGLGAYHGETGFLRFTHQKSVFVQSRWGMGHLLYPPYGARFERVMGLIRRLL